MQHEKEHVQEASDSCKFTDANRFEPAKSTQSCSDVHVPGFSDVQAPPEANSHAPSCVASYILPDDVRSPMPPLWLTQRNQQAIEEHDQLLHPTRSRLQSSAASRPVFAPANVALPQQRVTTARDGGFYFDEPPPVIRGPTREWVHHQLRDPRATNVTTAELKGTPSPAGVRRASPTLVIQRPIDTVWTPQVETRQPSQANGFTPILGSVSDARESILNSLTRGLPSERRPPSAEAPPVVEEREVPRASTFLIPQRNDQPDAAVATQAAAPQQQENNRSGKTTDSKGDVAASDAPKTAPPSRPKAPAVRPHVASSISARVASSIGPSSQETLSHTQQEQPKAPPEARNHSSAQAALTSSAPTRGLIKRSQGDAATSQGRSTAHTATLNSTPSWTPQKKVVFADEASRSATTPNLSPTPSAARARPPAPRPAASASASMIPISC